MKTLKDIQYILAQHKSFLRKQYFVKSIGVFGSYVRGEQNANSDIDILVEFDGPVGLSFLDLEEYLSKILNTKVDLVSRNALKPRIGQYILKELIPV